LETEIKANTYLKYRIKRRGEEIDEEVKEDTSWYNVKSNTTYICLITGNSQ